MDQLGGFSCKCLLGLVGTRCLIRDPCYMDPHSKSTQDKINHKDYCNYKGLGFEVEVGVVSES